MVMGDIDRNARHAQMWHQLQREAAARPESTKVSTHIGDIWMSPIEVALYNAMVAEGLVPTPQYCVEGYFVDFAFPDVRYAVEADGAAFHSGAAKQRDNKRDWILKNNGWTVQRFHGSTINDRAANCAFIVKRDVEGIRSVIREAAAARAAAKARKREARRALLLKIFPFLRRAKAPAAAQTASRDPKPPAGPGS